MLSVGSYLTLRCSPNVGRDGRKPGDLAGFQQNVISCRHWVTGCWPQSNVAIPKLKWMSQSPGGLTGPHLGAPSSQVVLICQARSTRELCRWPKAWLNKNSNILRQDPVTHIYTSDISLKTSPVF